MLGLDGNVKSNLKIVRVGQPVESKAFFNPAGRDMAEDEIQKVTLDYLVENRR